MSMGDGRAKNVLEYLDNLVEKSKATKGAITPLRTAFAKVLQTVDSENWEKTDVKSIDVEDYMARFANLTMGKYTSDSLAVYKSRMNKVVSWYIQFIDKPGWAPDIQRRNRTPRTVPAKQEETKEAEQPLSARPNMEAVEPESPRSMPEIVSAPGRVLYPYPLLDGQLIHISLPIKLLKDDAKRIAAFIESISIEVPTEGVKQ